MRHGEFVRIDDLPGKCKQVEVQSAWAPALTIPGPALGLLNGLHGFEEPARAQLRQDAGDCVDEIRLIRGSHR